jgi:hypothetical protein
MSKSMRALAAVCAVVLAAVIALWGFPLGNDVPQHVFVAFARNHLDDAALGFAAMLAPSMPPTNHGAIALLRMLEPLLGVDLAARATVVVVAEGWACAFFAFVSSVRPNHAAALLGFPLALQNALWLGLWSYLLATALSFVALACIARTSTWPRLACASLGLCAAALAHVVSAAAGGVVVLAILAARDGGRGVARAAVVCAPALAVTLWTAARSTGSLGVDEVATQSLLARTLFVLDAFASGPAWRPVTALALVVVALALAASSLRRASRGPERARDAALFACGAAFLALSMALPRDMFGWQFAGGRLAPFAAACAFASSSADGRKVKIAIGAGVAAFTIASFAWATQLHLALRAENEPILAAVDALAPAPRPYAEIMLDGTGDERRHDIVGFSPFIHIGALAAVHTGGAPLYGHIRLPTVHHLLAQPSIASLPVPTNKWWTSIAGASGVERHDQLRRLLARLIIDDGLVLLGRAEDVSTAREAGFIANDDRGEVASSRSLFVGHFVGCRGAIVVAGAPASFVADVGLWPSKEPDQGFRVEPGADGTARATIDRVACGEVWLHLPFACAGVDAGLPVRATFTSNRDNVLRCDVVASATVNQ